MSKIELSSTFAAKVPAQMLLMGNFGNTSANPGTVGLLQTGAPYGDYPMGAIYIMKGTMPTNLSTLETASARSSDVLVKFVPPSFSPTVQTTNPAVINTQYIAATAAGTASWFRWVTEYYDVITHQIIGTIGATGSGADLELASTAIAVNELVGISNFRISFPSSWTY